MGKISFLFLLVLTLSFNIVYSADGPNAWTLSYDNGGRIYAMVVDPVNQNIIYAAGLDSGVYKSTNHGVNWFQINSGMTYFKVQALAISRSNPSILYAGTDQLGGANSGIYKTTNGGLNWTFASEGITDSKGIQDIAVDHTNPNIAYAAVFDGLINSVVGLWKTTDGGVNWFAANTGVGVIKNFLSVKINPKNPNVVYAGTSFNQNPTLAPSKMYRSNDAGATWIDVSTGLPTGTATGNPIRWISISDLDTAVVLAGLFVNDSAGGIYLSTNGGQLWAKKYGIPNVVGTLPRAGTIRPGTSSHFYVGLDHSATGIKGVWRSTDMGATWQDFSSGPLPNTATIRALVFETANSDTTLFAGAASTTTGLPKGVYDYTFPAPVGIGVNNNPIEFNLAQNYPNPFNPVTTILYSIPKADNVKITVYDITGRLVSTLVNEFRQPGKYNILLDASYLSSGAYFYKIESGAYTDTKKMILIK